MKEPRNHDEELAEIEARLKRDFERICALPPDACVYDATLEDRNAVLAYDIGYQQAQRLMNAALAEIGIRVVLPGMGGESAPSTPRQTTH